MAEGNSKEASIQRYLYTEFSDIKYLGEGTFNKTYLAKHKTLQSCVFKVVSQTFGGKPKQKTKIENEVAEMFRISHEHIIAGYGIIMENNRFCLVYEFAKYGCLSSALHRIPIPMPLKIRIASQVSAAVEYLHGLQAKTIVHQNLKTTNVLLTKDFIVKVSDFLLNMRTVSSLATAERQLSQRRELNAGGTPVRKTRSTMAHMPPEAILNFNNKIAPSFDSYSYGIIIWELLTRKVPLEGLSSSDIREKMKNGYVLPYDNVPVDRPQVFFDIMNQAFTSQPKDRPTFTDISSRLKPLCKQFSEEARKAAVTCQEAYDSYFQKKREAIKSNTKERPHENAQKSVSSDARPFQATQREEPTVSYIEEKPIQIQASPFNPPTGVQPSLRPDAQPPTPDPPPSSGSPKEGKPQQSLDVGGPSTNVAIQGNVINLQLVQQSIAEPANDPPSPKYNRSNSFPAFESKRKISQDDYDVCQKYVGNRWRDLARKMKLTEGEIDAIEHNCKSYGLEEMIIKAVNWWNDRKNHGDATVDMLVKVLLKCEMGYVAKHLKP